MSKYKPIFETLHAEILAGRFAPDGKLPSEEMLCRRWKVSRPTVARALRNLQMQGLIDRRAGAGTFVKAETRPMQVTMGLLVEGLGKTEILDPICAEITRAAQQRGCGIFTGGLPAGMAATGLAGEWAAKGVRGIFFAPLEHVPADGPRREALNTGIVSAFQKAGVSVVLVDRDSVEFPARSNCDLVAMDNFHAGCSLGEHLAKRVAGGTGGMKGIRVAFVARPCFPSSTDLRLAGLKEGIRRLSAGGNAGRNVGRNASSNTGRNNMPESGGVDFHVGDPEEPGFVAGICKRTRGKPAYDAIVCSNDMTAARLMQVATGMGLRVPGDFRLAGFDDAGFATLLSVPLTTIRQPCRGIGIAGVDTMIGRLRHPELPPRTILLGGELLGRASTEV
jgi:LacI family transcriptional regulator